MATTTHTLRTSYMVAPKQTIFPGKLVLCTDVIKYDNEKGEVYKSYAQLHRPKIERQYHNFQLSPVARSKIIKKINWLFQCSKSRYVKSYSGKEIFNFKVNFLTLTLPSKQVHPTAEITKECFERFLNEMRNRVKMNNYVWRLEFQKNGNVHYHLVTDTYIDYHFVQKIWNRIINYLGYVDSYAQTMSEMSFSTYFLKYCPNDVKLAQKRYIKGRSEGWKNPPSVDVKSAHSQECISLYISKYFTKKEEDKQPCNELDNEENSKFIRLWYSSKSLSKFDTISEFIEKAEIPLEHLLEYQEGVKVVIHEYCKVIYFNFKQLSVYAKQILGKMFQDESRRIGYVPAI